MVAKNTVDVFKNKTLDGNFNTFLNLPASAFAAMTSAELAAIVSDETGSGVLVFATSPTLVTPVLGAATATSINKVAITAPATSATLTIANGKTLTASNTLTLAGTDGSSVAFGAGGTVAYTSNNLSTFAASTAAKSANYTILDDDGFDSIHMTTGGTNRTVTLPTPSANTGRRITIVKVDAASGKCDVLPDASETIGGTAIWQLSDKNDFVTVETGGTNWFVIASSGKFTVATNSSGTFFGGRIRRSIAINVGDAVATVAFRIKTTDGASNGGAYRCTFSGVVTHAASSGTSQCAIKAYEFYFLRAMVSGGTGVLSSVTEILESASLATSSASRDIGTVTTTVAESGEFATEVSISGNATGSNAASCVVVGEVIVDWTGFATPPEIEVS